METPKNSNSETVLATIVHLIAEVVYETNREYRIAIGEYGGPTFSEADESKRESIYRGILYRIQNPETTPEQQHIVWMKTKVAQGWVYGKTQNDELKMHPCMVPYEKLPAEQKAKDSIFVAIVKTMAKQYNLI